MLYNQNLVILTAPVENKATSTLSATIINTTLANPVPAYAITSTTSDNTALATPLPPTSVPPVFVSPVSVSPASIPSMTAFAAANNTPPPALNVTDDIDMGQNDEAKDESLSYDQKVTLIQIINNTEDNP